MHTFINQPFSLGTVQLPHRLIQGPLAGYSCAPFRQLFSLYTPPSYCVSEMLSAHDVIYKHPVDGRYLYRSPDENVLCYQISGTEPMLMQTAAVKLEALGADIIDINCGCPKAKIRKKGAGSALLEKPKQLIDIIQAVRAAIKCPLTVKIRIQGTTQDIELAKRIADAGANALIIHGRRWTDDYDIPCNLKQIAAIKQEIKIPVIANGSISGSSTLKQVVTETGCDAYMISRAGTGKPWLFQELLRDSHNHLDHNEILSLFFHHLDALAALEDEHRAVLQSKSLLHYYFKKQFNTTFLQKFYGFTTLKEIKQYLPLRHPER